MILQPKKTPHFLVLICVASFGTLALNIFIPSMPSLVDSLNTTPAMVQLTLSLYLLSLAFAQLVVGLISDKYGRRPILLLGLSIFILASIASSLATNIETLIIARIFQALGGCSGIVLTRAIVRDVHSKDKAISLLGYITMVVSIAPMLAPVIGGYLDQWYSWRASFYFVAAFGMVIAVIAVYNLHETHFKLSKNLNIANIPKQYWVLLKERQFLGYAFTLSFNNAVFFSFIAGAPFIVSDIMHLTPNIYALYFMMVAGGYMFGNFLAGRLASKFNCPQMIGIGNSAMFVGIILAIIGYLHGYDQPLYLFLPMGIIAISSGAISPNAIAGLLDIKPEIAGTASGLSGFMQMTTGAIGAFLVGVFHSNDGSTTVIFMAIFACLSFASYYGLVYNRRQHHVINP